MSPEIVAGLVGAATTAALAILNGFLTSRAQVAEEVRTARMNSYPWLWKLTSMLSFWPRTDLSLQDLQKLQRALRRWYFEVGGLYLSENARARYGQVQELLVGVAANLESGQPAASVRPSDGAYKDLQETLRALRNALTEDLETRGQRSLVRSVHLVWRHGRQHREAESRISAHKLDGEPARVPMEDWQQPDEQEL